MRRVLMLTAAAVLAAAPILHAQQSTTSPPPAQQAPPAAEAKPASNASVAGKWTITVEISPDPATLDLKLAEKKITGMLSGPMGEVPLTGDYTDGTLRFSISVNGQQGQMTVAFSGTLKDDDTMTGTMDFGQGAVNWRATRVKDK